MRVELREGLADDDGPAYRVLTSVTLEDGKVVLDPADAKLEQFLRDLRVIRPGEDGLEVVALSQGDDYLRALPFTLRNQYLYAALIEDS